MDHNNANSRGTFKKDSWMTTLLLAYQSLGVVYGDLSISILYVLQNTFAEDIHHSMSNVEIFGVFSLVFWTLTLFPLFKYVFIVLRFDDNGEGGTFALYSLLCRHVKVSLLPNRQVADEELSTYKLEQPPDKQNCSRLKVLLEKHKSLHTVLLILTLLGTCMVIGDGVLTPVISVFSAVSGLGSSMSNEHKKLLADEAITTIACTMLVFLFVLQHYGTHRVGFIFAPIVLAWLLCISALGLYNIFCWNPHIYKAISPLYILKFLKVTGIRGWLSLGGILLCITGSELMFADLGHFSYAAIQTAFTFLVYPALILAYMGQAAYLSNNHHMPTNISFFASVPDCVRWPIVILAVLASVVGNQAIITGTFSIINQCQSLCCFPKVRVVHTSDKIHGQIYLPEINWMLMILCIAVTVGFGDIRHMGNASGLAVMTVMIVTTCLTSLVIIICRQKPPILAISFALFFGSIELLYFSASLTKFTHGAWFPIVLAFFLMTIMFIWHYATTKKYEFDLLNKVSLEWILKLGPSLGVTRVPGIGIVFTDLTSGIPANFFHFVTNLPAYHRILVFVCVKSVPVPHVPRAERYLISRVGPAAHRSYYCIVRYGYRDVLLDIDSFESELFVKLADFIRYDWSKEYECGLHTKEDAAWSNRSSSDILLPANRNVQLSHAPTYEIEESLASVNAEFATVESITDIEMQPAERRVRFATDVNDSESDAGVRVGAQLQEELEDLSAAQEVGTAFILGNSHVKAKQESSFLKKLVIDHVYSFMKINCGPEVALKVPPASTIEVGMVYIV